jgi:hypothetical protein
MTTKSQIHVTPGVSTRYRVFVNTRLLAEINNEQTAKSVAHLAYQRIADLLEDTSAIKEVRA